MVCLRSMVSWLISAKSSAKPRSNIRSASSTTKNCTLSNLICIDRCKSSKRPGVATTKLAFCNLAICNWYGIPPTTLATRKPRQCLTKSIASCATCCASSRVGQTIKAPGVGALKLRTLVGSLRLAFLGGSSPLAIASATDFSYSARSATSASACCLSKVCKTGNKNAAVLPLPVWLDTIKSM